MSFRIINSSGATIPISDSNVPIFSNSHISNNHILNNHIPNNHIPNNHIPNSHIPNSSLPTLIPFAAQVSSTPVRTLHSITQLKLSFEVTHCFGISKDPVTNEFIMIISYAENGSLHNYLQQRPNLNWSTRINYLLKISQGLDIIHSAGLIHKDFHSGNILMGKRYPMVSDFGLCRQDNNENNENIINDDIKDNITNSTISNNDEKGEERKKWYALVETCSVGGRMDLSILKNFRDADNLRDNEAFYYSRKIPTIKLVQKLENKMGINQAHVRSINDIISDTDTLSSISNDSRKKNDRTSFLSNILVMLREENENSENHENIENQENAKNQDNTNSNDDDYDKNLGNEILKKGSDLFNFQEYKSTHENDKNSSPSTPDNNTYNGNSKIFRNSDSNINRVIESSPTLSTLSVPCLTRNNTNYYNLERSNSINPDNLIYGNMRHSKTINYGNNSPNLNNRSYSRNEYSRINDNREYSRINYNREYSRINDNRGYTLDHINNEITSDDNIIHNNSNNENSSGNISYVKSSREGMARNASLAYSELSTHNYNRKKSGKDKRQ
ncbi:6128_t:CDS:2 [Diversispora eburnea]|uniref:6128_t:CDS:1 n=1 Tax=Diversispora eburnea TaxID=1213867 RepID=A0A9N8WPE7_9GLOM|nr:6128_t:CDS:2 [Diversispora eburnea]